LAHDHHGLSSGAPRWTSQQIIFWGFGSADVAAVHILDALVECRGYPCFTSDKAFADASVWAET